MNRKFRKILAILMVLAVVVGSVPVFASTSPTPPALALAKSVTPVNNSSIADDCLTYDVTLTASGAIPTAVSTYDIVLVLDTSGSMDGSPLNSLKNAAKAFIDRMSAYNPNCRIAVIEYSSGYYGGNAYNTSGGLKTLSTGAGLLKSSIDTMWAYGGTDLQAGIKMGYEILNASTSGNKKVMLVMSDGVANLPYHHSGIDYYDDGDVQINGTYLNAKTATLNSTFVQPVTGFASIFDETNQNYPTYHTYNTSAAILRSDIAKANNISIYSVGMLNKLKDGTAPKSNPLETTNRIMASYYVGKDTLDKVSSGSGCFYEADENTITAVFNNIASSLVPTITVTDVINTEDFAVVGTPTASIGTAGITGSTLTWSFTGAQYSGLATVTFRVKAKQYVTTENSGLMKLESYNAAANGRILSTTTHTANTNVGQASMSVMLGTTPMASATAPVVADVSTPGFTVVAGTSGGITKFASGTAVNLTATPSIFTDRCVGENVSYVWTQVGGTWTSSVQNPQFTLTADTQLIVTATTSAGHVASAVLNLTTAKNTGISVVKTIESPTDTAHIKIGDAVVYKVVITNTSSDSQAISGMTVADSIASVTGPFNAIGDTTVTAWPTDLAAGASSTRYYKYTAAESNITEGKITNRVTATGTSDGETISNYGEVEFTPYYPSSNISVDKKVYDDNGDTWVDSATFFSNSSVTALYKIIVKNTGDADGTFNLSDTFGTTNVATLYSDEDLQTQADITDVSIAKEGELVYYFAGSIDSGESIVNTATASAEQAVTTTLTDSVTVNVVPVTTVTINVDKVVAFGTFSQSNDSQAAWNSDISKVLASIGSTEAVTFKITVSADFTEMQGPVVAGVTLSDKLDNSVFALGEDTDDLDLMLTNIEEGADVAVIYIRMTLGAGTHTNVATISDPWVRPAQAVSMEGSDGPTSNPPSPFAAVIGTGTDTATVTLTNPQTSSQTSSITSSTSSGTPLRYTDPGATSQTSSVVSSAATTVIPTSSVPMAAPSSSEVVAVISEESVPTESPDTGAESSAVVYATLALLTSGIAITIFSRRKKEDK